MQLRWAVGLGKQPVGWEKEKEELRAQQDREEQQDGVKVVVRGRSGVQTLMLGGPPGTLGPRTRMPMVVVLPLSSRLLTPCSPVFSLKDIDCQG